MKPFKIFPVLLLCITLFSCAVGIPIEKKAPQNNTTYKVEYLFEHDGCKVYRFWDYGNYVYFTNCRESVTSIGNDSTATRVYCISGQNKENGNHNSVLQLPQFPGGNPKFIEYFHKSVKYPLACQQKNQEGKVICNFNVYRNGHISNVEITQKADSEMDKEVLRIINEMPQWTPVSTSLLSPAFSQYTVTVIFKLNGTEYGKDASENDIVVIGYGTSEKPVITN